MSNPIFENHNPVKGYIGAHSNVPIFFRAQDIHGVDVTSLNVTVQSVPAIVNGIFQADIIDGVIKNGFEGTITLENSVPNSISVVIYQRVETVTIDDEDITRIVNLGYNQIVNVEMQINDLQGHIGSDSYTFLTLPNSTIDKPIVTVSPHGKLFNSSLNVELVCSDLSASIRYTLDGTIPNLYSPVYSSPISISSEGITILKYVALLSNTYSDFYSETYLIDSIAPVSQATPNGGVFFTSQEIVLSTDDPKSTIYYTSNGTVPTISSSVYVSPIRVRDNYSTTIKFFAIDKAGNQEAVHTEIYQIEIAKNNYISTNIFVTSPFSQDELYIRWDDMYLLFNEVVGYNIYRAHTEMGPYEKLNLNVLTITQYSDKTLDTQIINEDVSEQFKRTVNISKEVNDSFNSTGPFDVSKWKEIDAADLLFQYNGAIFKDGVGLKQTSKLISNFKLRSDFDIHVKFNLLKWISPDVGMQSCSFFVSLDDNNYIEVSRVMSHTVDVFCTQQFVNSNPDLPITLSSSEVAGEFKITRSGSIVTTYFLDNVTGNFIQLGVFEFTSDDVHVGISGKSEDKQVEMRFSDFKVLTGNPIIIQPLNPRKEYLVYLSQRPVVDDTGKNKPTDDAKFINVSIDGQQGYVRLLQGLEGVIELETDRMYDEVKKQYFTPPVPNEFSTVIVSYRVPSHTTNIRLRKSYFYKVTCVTSEDETDLDLITPVTVEPEKMTYMLEEAVRRNAWLLDQGGERVLLYIKKKAGTKCHCTYRDMKERTHKQADQDCETCFGSGFVGGFDGPYPITIGPLTTEQRVQQTDRGLKLAYQIETWMGPTPVVNQRDMIIRRNGDRCLVGPLTPVEGPGGVRVQQHFIVEILDGTDIRYKFKVILPGQTMQPGIDKSSRNVLHGGLNVAEVDSPKEREEFYTSEDHVSHENSNVDHVVKGRSMMFENTEY